MERKDGSGYYTAAVLVLVLPLLSSFGTQGGLFGLERLEGLGGFVLGDPKRHYASLDGGFLRLGVVGS